jgi:hypothetical protein
MAIVSILAQPVLLVFIHGPLMTVCAVLAIIAIDKDQVKRGVQLLLASIFMLPMISPFPCSFGLWVSEPLLGAHSTTSAMVTPSAPTRLVSRQTPISLDSLKNRFLDQVRTQQTVSIADFRTDQEIEIEIQPESNFDSAKAKNAALTVAKGWHNESHQ